MTTVQHCQTRWTKELRGAPTKTRAECTNHRVVVDGSKTQHLLVFTIRDEDFASRRHQGNTKGIQQRAGGSRQLSHPGAIRGPQHCHTMVALIRNEEKEFVGGQRQATRFVDLAGLMPPRTNGALPFAVQLKQWEEELKRGYLIIKQSTGK
jgi:hypothetical protein